jgi:predicted oxidoreductase (fatty acid repression mutant protein)
LNSFEAGYGTVLYFEDQQTVEGLQKQFPAYAANFPIWSQQASGMLQYIIWTAFAAEGLGATLQHYSPLIDAQVGWGLPGCSCAGRQLLWLPAPGIVQQEETSSYLK